MNAFEQALEESWNEVEDGIDYVLDFLYDSCDGDFETLKEELELDDEEFQELEEQLRRRVDSKGKVSRTKTKKVRKRQATRTTGMSQSQLRRRGRKAAKSRKRNPAGVRQAKRKRSKAMKRRKQMGIS